MVPAPWMLGDGESAIRTVIGAERQFRCIPSPTTATRGGFGDATGHCPRAVGIPSRMPLTQPRSGFGVASLQETQVPHAAASASCGGGCLTAVCFAGVGEPHMQETAR